MPIYSAEGTLRDVANSIWSLIDLINKDETITDYRLSNNFSVKSNHLMFKLEARELDAIWEVRSVGNIELMPQYVLTYKKHDKEKIEAIAQGYMEECFRK